MKDSVKFFVLSFVTTGLLFAACSRSTSKKNDNPPPATDQFLSYYSMAKADFPACNAARKGALAYANDEQKFYACDGSSWNEVTISTTGPAGPTGATGATGPTGATGAAGSGGLSIYDASGNKVGALVSFSFDDGSAIAQLSDGWSEFNVASGKFKGVRLYDINGTPFILNATTNAKLYFTSASCVGNVIVPCDSCTVSSGGIHKTQLVPMKKTTVGGAYWMVLDTSSAYGTSSTYNSLATYNTTTGYFECDGPSSSGTTSTSKGGLVVSYTSIGGIGTATVSGGGTGYLTYPLAAPLKFGN